MATGLISPALPLLLITPPLPPILRERLANRPRPLQFKNQAINRPSYSTNIGVVFGLALQTVGQHYSNTGSTTLSCFIAQFMIPVTQNLRHVTAYKETVGWKASGCVVS